MNSSILETIIKNKKQWINIQTEKTPLRILQNKVQISNRNFYNALNKKKTVFILECKKASPSKGIICENFDLIKIANIYKYYASVISVLTDKKYFHGNFNFLRIVSNVVTQPILCKDFIISPWQIYLSRLFQADAILLMLSILDDNTYQKLTMTANRLNMGVLTEITNKEEWERAINLGAKVIGINNRNLHDCTIDLQRTVQLTTSIKNRPKDTIIISESGINHNQDIRQLRQYVNGFLIGSALTSANNINVAVKRILLGENKICGLTRTIDAKAAYQAGAIYGGLIFIPESPRFITINQAYEIISQVHSLNYVGVFRNAQINYIINLVNLLNLSAIQLHGKENTEYIEKLYKKLKKQCFIWKALDANQHLQIINVNNKIKTIKRYVLDNGQGGTGKTFNWSLLKDIKLNRNNIILSGGLTIQNCITAAKLGCAGLDFNSGIENSPGIKDHYKINKIFQILRTY